MAISTLATPRPRALSTILGGGLLAGILDHADATIHFTLMMGIPQSAMFHYIASGLIGMKASMRLGPVGVLLGVLLHFTIAIGAAAVYYLAALKLPILIRRPFFSGTIFGLGLYIFMTYIVVPLSAVPKNPHQTFSWIELASGLFAHIVLIGIPIALIAQRSARVKPSKAV
jgi:hypothetical protein